MSRVQALVSTILLFIIGSIIVITLVFDFDELTRSKESKTYNQSKRDTSENGRDPFVRQRQ